MTYDKTKQAKAIKNCLKRMGWAYVKVTHLRTNTLAKHIKTYEVLFDCEVNPTNPTFCYEITVFSTGIEEVRSRQTVMLSIINALNRALKEAK